MSWRENRGPDDRMRIYRVTIKADVASNFQDSIGDEIADLLGERDSWDILEVEVIVRPREEGEEQ